MPKATSEQSARVLATASDYQATFEGFKPGTKVLEDLVARFHDRPIYVRGGDEAQRETDARAAQHEVIGFILRRLAQIEEEPDA